MPSDAGSGLPPSYSEIYTRFQGSHSAFMARKPLKKPAARGGGKMTTFNNTNGSEDAARS